MNRPGDIVLIYYQDKPTVYARIEHIEPDVKRDWYQITLLLLTIPAQTVTWILRDAYINGTSFTMGGQSMRLEAVKPAEFSVEDEDPAPTSGEKGKGKPAKVIPFKGSEE